MEPALQILEKTSHVFHKAIEIEEERETPLGRTTWSTGKLLRRFESFFGQAAGSDGDVRIEN